MRFRSALTIAAVVAIGVVSIGRGAGAAVASAGSDTTTVTVPDAFTSVTVRTLGASSTYPFLGTDERWHVSYNVQLVNTSRRVTATIDRFDVVDAARPDTVVGSIEGNQLVDPDCEVGDCNRLRMMPAAPAPDVEIAPQEGRVLFVDLSFASKKDVPRTVLHHLFAEAADNPRATEPAAVDYLAAPYDIRDGKAPVIGPPLAGDNWVALNSCCEVGFAHRSSPNSVNGEIVNGQHFAIDWKQMDENGEFFAGDPNLNESYADYGADVLAVADGTVVSVLDGMQANRPGTLPATDPELADTITIETVDGNHVVLDLGNGVYAFYAHLRAGSLTVEEGDKVTRGEKIAELGNTGNANASHLHFHLMDGPSVLGSNGLPYAIDRFDDAGQVAVSAFLQTDDFLSGVFDEDRLAKPEPRTRQFPLLLDIVDFPASQ